MDAYQLLADIQHLPLSNAQVNLKKERKIIIYLISDIYFSNTVHCNLSQILK